MKRDTDLSEGFNVVEGLQPFSEGVDDAHVVLLLHEALLGELEDGDGVPEEHLRWSKVT